MGLQSIYDLIVLLGIIAIIVEIILGAPTGFDLLLSGLILIISGFLGNFFNSQIVMYGSIAFLSLFYIFFGRAFIKNKLTPEDRKTNADALIGKKAVVIKTITHEHPGQVKVEGEIWRAQANAKIEPGTQVAIDTITGVTVHVNKIEI